MADFPEWQHHYIATKPYPDAGKNGVIQVEAGLLYIQGNRRPYFSISAAIARTSARLRSGDWESSGRDPIEAVWPELRPILALHVSDDLGVPMHAEANGWYQLAGYYGGAGERYHAGNLKRQIWKPDGTFDGFREPTADECLASWADHIRISVDGARAIADGWRDSAQYQLKFGSIARSFLRNQHQQFITNQIDRWREEAEAGIRLLDYLIAQQK